MLDNLLYWMDTSNRDAFLAPLFARMDAAYTRGETLDIGAELNALPTDVPLSRTEFFVLRDAFVERYGYALPGTGFVETLRPYGPFLEIAAGKGTLGAILRAAGIPCVSTDITPWENNADVLPLDGTAALARYPNRTVLCAWPDYQSTWLTDLCATMPTGTRLALIGEGKGGCTGDDSLFDLLSTWTRCATTPKAIWSWPGINDNLIVFQKP